MILLNICGFVNAQNIVQNPSWEVNTGIPSEQGEVSLATGWRVLITNSDFLHNDGFTGWTPINGGAFDGSGYVGVGGPVFASDYSEALGGYLQTPIEAGQNYAVSMAVQLTNGPSLAGDFSGSCVGISIYGFQDYELDEFFPGHLNDIENSQMLWTSEVISNTEWEVVTGCFQAQSDANFIGLPLAPDITCATYIYLDMLEIIPVSASGDILGEDISSCENQEVILQIPEFVDSQEWSTGSTADELVVSESGVYWVDYMVGDCSSSDTILVTSNPIAEFDLGENRVLCAGESYIIEPSGDIGPVRWQDGSIMENYIAEESGIYTAILEQGSCSSSDNIQIDFVPCDCEVYIPNALTPDQNSLNEVFKPISVCDFEEYHLTVYNRWGDNIFESKDPDQHWNGGVGDYYTPDGVYNRHSPPPFKK